MNRKSVRGEQPPVGYIWCKANGGYLWHLMIQPGTNVSACGHTPKDTAWKMRQRGKWKVLTNPENGLPNEWGTVCNKCEVKVNETSSRND